MGLVSGPKVLAGTCRVGALILGDRRSTQVRAKRRARWETASALQILAKRWALGCMKSLPVARRRQEAGFTHPRDHLLADPYKTTVW